MSLKTVVASDGRTWAVRSNLERDPPLTGDEFEHDVDGGRGAVLLILSALALFWLALLFWLGSLVHIPLYLWLIGIVIVAFFPSRWALRRPWTLVAETPGIDNDRERPPEHWSGMVRGRARAKDELRVVERNLRQRGTPGHADSPLHPVN